MTNNLESERFKMQDDQYEFPYHYIPYFNDGSIINFRYLSWSFEYMVYLLCCKEIVLEIKPQSVLDVGCGDGRFLGLLSNNIQNLKGVDLSDKAIKIANIFNKNIVFEAIDAGELSEAFDMVTAIEVLEHIPDDLK